MNPEPAGPAGPVSAGITVVPANEASWGDLRAIFGTRGYASRCQGQRFKIGNAD